MLENAAPFATPPTVIQTDISDVKKAMMGGIGMAIGLAIAGYVLFHVFGKKT